MGIEDELKKQGWTEHTGSGTVTNTKTNESVELSYARRLVSPDGRQTYRTDSGRRTTYSSDENISLI